MLFYAYLKKNTNENTQTFLWHSNCHFKGFFTPLTTSDSRLLWIQNRYAVKFKLLYTIKLPLFFNIYLYYFFFNSALLAAYSATET